MNNRVVEATQVLQEAGHQTFAIVQQDFRDDPAGALRRVEAFGPDVLTAPNYNYLLLAAVGNPAVLNLSARRA